jgi:chromosome segregation ATPase
LSKRYTKLRDSSTSENDRENEENERVFNQSFDYSTNENSSLKTAYEHLYDLFVRQKNKFFLDYNKLHDEYLKLSLVAAAPPKDALLNSKVNLLKSKLKAERLKNAENSKEIQELTEHLNSKIENIEFKNLNKLEIEDLSNRLQSEILQSDLLKRQVTDLEMQIELNRTKLNSLNLQQKEKEKEFQAYQEKIDQIEKREQVNLSELNDLNKKLTDEIDNLKRDSKNFLDEKLELEITIEDLKRTLKLTEKESQHIRAKLLITPEDEALKIKNRYDALLPSNNSNNIARSASNISMASLEKSEIFNDFAIDITHIEKVVQETDSNIMEQKPLSGVHSCLQTLRDQMSDLQRQANQDDTSISSSTWKYKLGFQCEKCEMNWQVEHQVQGKTTEGGADEFLDSPITQNVPRCNCYKMGSTLALSEETDPIDLPVLSSSAESI